MKAFVSALAAEALRRSTTRRPSRWITRRLRPVISATSSVPSAASAASSTPGTAGKQASSAINSSRSRRASWLTTGAPSTITGTMVTLPSSSSTASMAMIGKAPIR